MSINLSTVELSDRDKLELKSSQQLEFLLTVLSSINESDGNSDVIYTLFPQNSDLLDLDITEVLRDWANSKFNEIDRDQQESIAIDIFKLGNLFQQFPLGNKDVNIECSIECYVLALQIFSVKENFERWAKIQNNLATAYIHRVIGDHAENLEQSIKCYRAALGVYTQTDFPLDRAMTQNNLANAYNKRIRGDWVENLERSIKTYRAALNVITQKDLPIDWAMIQNNLAAIYSYRIRGDKTENLKRSIAGYESALQVYTQIDFPIDWAMTQNNLAIAYKNSDDLERSIESYYAALEVYTPESFPREWAKIQIDLARFSIENLRNYQVATEHLQSAYEQLLTNNNDTGLLAQTMFELARCFHKTGCLGQAKIYFKDSIRLYQRLEQPTQVAAATSALGNLELQMGAIDDARIHLQTALEFYQAAGNLDRVASIQDLQQCLPEYSPEPAI
jgi:tetratricopeptide (TPR) repeat protein